MACHTTPFLKPGLVIDTSGSEAQPVVIAESCDYCGSANIVWRKCKLICTDCQQINKSCADL